MRRFVNALLVVSLAVSLTATTAHAAPRRDGGDTYLTPLKKLVQLIKKAVKGMDGSEMSIPKP